MAKITINGNQVEVEDGITIIQACEDANVEIPRFCYHERLKIAGNCRMCLVEVEKAPKLVASCAMPVSEGMVIHTDSPKVKSGRESVMEFLLINHPLDCPICDQGGECDLQDQAFKYGKGSTRFNENKRSVKDKYMGPLVKTHMTRCIHCTRCVRFMTDIAGVEELGAAHRGEHMEITTYLEKAISSELSGNIIDLCPVGALTSKPYAYKARNWELKKTESIDISDGLGSNIRIDSRGLEVMRILPKNNDEINEEWISDKARFSYDGLKNQRIDKSYIKIDGKFKPVNYEDAIDHIAELMRDISSSEIGIISGDLSDCETIFAAKKFMQKLGSKNYDFNQNNYIFDYSSEGNYLFNTNLYDILESDFIIGIGTDLRKNASVLNAKIGRNVRDGLTKFCRIGNEDDQTYKIQELGNSANILTEILNGNHKICKDLMSASKPAIIIGDGVYRNSEAQKIYSLIGKIIEKYNIIKDDWNGYNLIHSEASNVGAIKLGFSNFEKASLSANQMINNIEQGDLKLLFLMGADNLNISPDHEGMIIYIGHHGDKGANIADIIIPAPTYTEKDGTFVNTEGRVQNSYKAVQALNGVKEDWKILSDIAKKIGINCEIDNIYQIRNEMMKILGAIDKLPSEKVKFSEIKDDTQLDKVKIEQKNFNFYFTNSIARASVTMAKCSSELSQREGA